MTTVELIRNYSCLMAATKESQLTDIWKQIFGDDPIPTSEKVSNVFGFKNPTVDFVRAKRILIDYHIQIIAEKIDRL